MFFLHLWRSWRRAATVDDWSWRCVCVWVASISERSAQTSVCSASKEDQLLGGTGREIQALENNTPRLGWWRRRQRPVRIHIQAHQHTHGDTLSWKIFVYSASKNTKGWLQERHSNLHSVECHSRLESPLNQFSLQENIVLSSWVYLREWTNLESGFCVL